MPRSESDDREGRSQRYGHSVVMCRRQDQEPTGPSPTAAVMTQPMANQMQIPSSCASVAFGSTHERTLIPRRVISYAASPASATTADALLRSTSASPPLAATSSGGPHRSRSLLVPAEDQRQRSARFGNDQQNPGNPSVRVAPVLPPPAFMANDASELGRRAGALGHGSYATVELTVIAANRTPGGQTGQQLKPGAYAVKQLVGPQNVDRTRSGASGFCDGDALREVSVARTIGNELRHVVGAVRAFRCPDEDVVTFIMRLECGMTLSDTMVALNSQQAHLKKAACDAEVPANGFNPKIIDTDDRMKTVLFDTLIGLCEMHSSGISHSDFKVRYSIATS